jgi:hypothetical protein
LVNPQRTALLLGRPLPPAAAADGKDGAGGSSGEEGGSSSGQSRGGLTATSREEAISRLARSIQSAGGTASIVRDVLEDEPARETAAASSALRRQGKGGDRQHTAADAWLAHPLTVVERALAGEAEDADDSEVEAELAGGCDLALLSKGLLAAAAAAAATAEPVEADLSIGDVTSFVTRPVQWSLAAASAMAQERQPKRERAAPTDGDTTKRTKPSD